MSAFGSQLESLLVAMIDEHASLIDTAKHHRDALARADLPDITSRNEDFRSSLTRIAELESKRQDIVRDALGGSFEAIALEDALTRVEGEERERLRTLGTRLRELVLETKQQTASVRLATEALSTHVHALIAQIGSRMSHAGTYGGSGRVEARATVLTGLDVVS